MLDFVMALVRDPDAAARYAADPGGALAQARLDGVTTADVSNLLPVVADSLAMSTPGFGAAIDPAQIDPATVWTSGAAIAAFDAFGLNNGGAHGVVAGDPAQGVVAPVVVSADADGDRGAAVAHSVEPLVATPEDVPHPVDPPVGPPDWAPDSVWPAPERHADPGHHEPGDHHHGLF